MSVAPQSGRTILPGVGLVWLVAPHPGRIRATPVGGGGALGRDDDAVLRIDAPGIAGQHARIELVPRAMGTPEIYVTDLGTPSGTFVSGMRAQRTVLHEGDLLRVGSAIALLVEKDVASFEGNVVDEGGVVRGPRSRRGWFMHVERAASCDANARCAWIFGPIGVGRHTIARRLATAWGSDEELTDVDVSAATSPHDLERLVAPTKSILVLRGVPSLSPPMQQHLARLLAGRKNVVAIAEEAPQGVHVELSSIFAHTIEIPSLEHRREEIPALVRYRFERAGVPQNRLSIELYEALTRAAWPGEVKELVEVVDRIAAAHPDVPRLGPEHLSRPLSRRGGRVASRTPAGEAATEADRIRAALVDAKGSVAAAARALHLSRQALYREASRLGIDIRRARTGESDEERE